ncbi:outer membrane protein assembly factor BamB family protein [Rhodococcus coprophilus]|uniref:outer membrane protein assembly factor BamB family protein n=1 Tax=Rhodococcus coprophilus TaxID=38310 RepID=UPI0009330445|nr:PQQ-binding-like beta-propeller repeat protein [Rhodococcus coprophilus]MBM7460685.1 hypothetical protein [Rhodococcus coprophilus]
MATVALGVIGTGVGFSVMKEKVEIPRDISFSPLPGTYAQAPHLLSTSHPMDERFDVVLTSDSSIVVSAYDYKAQTSVLRSIDVDTGETLWTSEQVSGNCRGRHIPNSSAIACTADAGEVTVFSASNGAPIFARPASTDGDKREEPTVVVDGDNLAICTPGSDRTRLEYGAAEDFDPQWTVEVGHRQTTICGMGASASYLSMTSYRKDDDRWFTIVDREGNVVHQNLDQMGWVYADDVYAELRDPENEEEGWLWREFPSGEIREVEGEDVDRIYGLPGNRVPANFIDNKLGLIASIYESTPEWMYEPGGQFMMRRVGDTLIAREGGYMTGYSAITGYEQWARKIDDLLENSRGGLDLYSIIMEYSNGTNDGFNLIGSTESEMFCIAASTGALLWSLDEGGQIVAVHNDMIVVRQPGYNHNSPSSGDQATFAMYRFDAPIS